MTPEHQYIYPAEYSPQEQKIIETIIHSLEQYAFTDIVKTLQLPITLATFTLCVCFIDVLSHHRYFDDKKKTKDKAKFIAFIEDYFPDRYHGQVEDIYTSLRSKLVHNYSSNKLYNLISGKSHSLHFTTDKNGKTILVAEQFISDIRNAFENYAKDLRFNKEIGIIAINHYKKYPVFQATELD